MLTTIFIVVAIFIAIATFFVGFLLGKLRASNNVLKLEKEKSAWESERKSFELKVKEYQESLNKVKEEMHAQFEVLANNILDAKTKKMQEVSEKSIGDMLSPLRERMGEFQKKVEDLYTDEAKERRSLRDAIKDVVSESQKLFVGTDSLTKALKGDVKTQGAWGEMILETILESSGLVKDVEYTVQAEEMGLKDEHGNTQKPDIIITLPENKHLVVDSKVSLVSYNRYVSEDDELKKKVHLTDFLKSVYAHIDMLSNKKYQTIEKLNSPDFVLLFMPMEGAFSLAVQNDKELFSYAWSKNIGVVSPNNLLATLRTVSSIWKMENQNKYAKEIARQGAALYDKFAGLFEDIESIGRQLDLTRKAYDETVNKLKYGKGNLLNRVESLKKLGVKPSKSLPTGDDISIEE